MRMSIEIALAVSACFTRPSHPLTTPPCIARPFCLHNQITRTSDTTILTTATDDIKILPNDWPYGLDTRIKHLVIWTKFSLPSNPITSTDPDGDLTPEARTAINDFVQKHFVKVCGQENVIWFKNWSALKSIHAVEHFHVMVFDEDGRFSGHGGVLGDMAGGDEVFTRLEEGGRG